MLYIPVMMEYLILLSYLIILLITLLRVIDKHDDK